ncbi:MAG: hypothetical protein M1547_09280 [Gammaproteobacteria bacterium]|nr:hypothetical protein [Gammaproteobacteria bacterium]
MSAAKTLTHDWSPGGLLNKVEDSDGHRIRKTVSGTATHSLYQGPDLAAEYAGWTSPQAVYTHGPA